MRKPGHARRGHHLAERIVEVALDVVAGDRHRDVPLAGAGAGHLDLQLQRLIVGLLGVGIAIGLDGGSGRLCLVGKFVVVGAFGGHRTRTLRIPIQSKTARAL